MCRHLSFWAKGWPAILKERNSFTVHNGYFNLLLVNKSLQAWSSVLNEVFLKNSIVTSKRHLSFEGLTGEWRHNNLGEDEDLKQNIDIHTLLYSAHLAVPLQFISQPLKVGISPTNTWLLHPEDRKVCLQIQCWFKIFFRQSNISLSPRTLSRTS